VILLFYLEFYLTVAVAEAGLNCHCSLAEAKNAKLKICYAQCNVIVAALLTDSTGILR
jgi:hypothetical protein